MALVLHQQATTMAPALAMAQQALAMAQQELDTALQALDMAPQLTLMEVCLAE
jgi:hypothetical protein